MNVTHLEASKQQNEMKAWESKNVSTYKEILWCSNINYTSQRQRNEVVNKRERGRDEKEKERPVLETEIESERKIESKRGKDRKKEWK